MYSFFLAKSVDQSSLAITLCISIEKCATLLKHHRNCLRQYTFHMITILVIIYAILCSVIIVPCVVKCYIYIIGLGKLIVSLY